MVAQIWAIGGCMNDTSVWWDVGSLEKAFERGRWN